MNGRTVLLAGGGRLLEFEYDNQRFRLVRVRQERGYSYFEHPGECVGTVDEYGGDYVIAFVDRRQPWLAFGGVVVPFDLRHVRCRVRHLGRDRVLEIVSTDGRRATLVGRQRRIDYLRDLIGDRWSAEARDEFSMIRAVLYAPHRLVAIMKLADAGITAG